ncbi:type 1 periplasmic binding fold superfamily protein [Aequorivita marina]|uniref:type 1 periplasmic binding fold superfamily protein n=1 Tax=Aequorivita marina TaxID=3073654 RepID=UPI002874F73A|nr:type 1 periplasmic binding fold superfamily protein [Aequorivita sp. S2608]MDS1298003.1 type 1 periplasmic binding fold superfamily protein [Aequorivita sp. S2608]
MKKVKFLATALFATVLFAACSSDDDTPKPVNEEELITTMTVTLTPMEGGTPVILQTRDLDGDGPNPPVVTVSGNLATGASYTGSIILLNETESPAEDITEEVEEEAVEHQFFYTANSGLDVTTEYSNFDSNGDPLGTEFTLTAGEASSGVLTFTLRHEPIKPNTGLGDAGGETDFAASYDVTVE